MKTQMHTIPEEKASVFLIACTFAVRKSMGNVSSIAMQILSTEGGYEEIPCFGLYKILAFTEADAQTAAIELAVQQVGKDFYITNSGKVNAETIEKLTGIHGIAESVITGR